MPGVRETVQPAFISYYPQEDAHRRQAVSLCRVWESFRSEIEPRHAPEIALGRATPRVPGLREKFQSQVSPGHAPENPHGGETPRVPGLRENVWSPVGPDDAPGNPHGRETPSMRGLREKLQ